MLTRALVMLTAVTIVADAVAEMGAPPAPYVKCTARYASEGRRREPRVAARCESTYTNGPFIRPVPIGRNEQAPGENGIGERIELRVNAWNAADNVRTRILQYETFPAAEGTPPTPAVQRSWAVGFVSENGRRGTLDFRAGLGDTLDPGHPACVFAKSVSVRCVMCRDGEENQDATCDREEERAPANR